MTDLIATLRAYLGNTNDMLLYNEAVGALIELERRARIEARRDSYLASKPGLRCAHRIEGGFHWICFFVLGERQKRPVFDGPDYHTALESALNAVGAP
jgi:hypothetical protein